MIQAEVSEKTEPTDTRNAQAITNICRVVDWRPWCLERYLDRFNGIIYLHVDHMNNLILLLSLFSI